MSNNVQSSGHSILTRIMLMFIVLSFCLWGIGDIFSQGGGTGAVAKVGKKSISQAEFRQEVQNQQDVLREKLGKMYSPELAKKFGVEKQALDALINRLAVEQETAALGVSVGEDDVADAIASNTGFHDDKGQFNKDIYLQTLQANHRSEQAYIRGLQQQLATKLLVGVITSDMTLPEDLVQAIYRVRFEKRTAGLLIIPANAAVAVQPADKDVKAYYDTHTEKFLVPEYRTISYVELKEEDVRANIQVSDAEVQKAYNDRADEFKVSERRVLEQVLFEKKEDVAAAAALLAKGKSLAEVAASLHATNKDKLSLGELTKQNTPVAADTVFSLKEGGFTDPVQSAFGWHILHVVKIIPPGTRPLADVREQIVKDISAQAAQNAASKMSNSFEDAMGGGASLEEAAKKTGLQLHVLPAVTREGKGQDGTKATLPAYSNFLEVGFTTAEKDHSRMEQAEGGNYFMLHVDEIKPQHARPLESVLPQVTEEVRQEQSGKQLRDFADRMAADIKAGKKPQDVLAGKKIETTLESSGPLLRSSELVATGKLSGRVLPAGLVAELFKLEAGGFTGAYALEGGGYMIGRLDEVVAAPDVSKEGAETTALNQVREEMKESFSREVQYSYVQHLRKKYPVTVNASSVTTSAVNDEE